MKLWVLKKSVSSLLFIYISSSHKVSTIFREKKTSYICSLCVFFCIYNYKTIRGEKKKKIYENQNYSFQTNHTLVSFENNHVICREISFSSVLENKFHWDSGVPVNMSTEILKNQLIFSWNDGRLLPINTVYTSCLKYFVSFCRLIGIWWIHWWSLLFLF